MTPRPMHFTKKKAVAEIALIMVVRFLTIVFITNFLERLPVKN